MWAGPPQLLQRSPQDKVGQEHDPVRHGCLRPRAGLSPPLAWGSVVWLDTMEKKLKGIWRRNLKNKRYDSTLFTFGEVEWFPPLGKLQCFLPLVLKAFPDPLPPQSWLYIQHPTNDFLLKNEKNIDTCLKTEWNYLFILLLNIKLVVLCENVQILHKY